MSNPGARQWDIRPAWHSVVYGGSKPSGKAESVVSPEALRAWPVRFDENGKLAKPPADSKHHGVEVVTETRGKTKPYRRRRSSAQLRQEVIDLNKRGLVVAAIANQLNVADRRVKEILAEAVAA